MTSGTSSTPATTTGRCLCNAVVFGFTGEPRFVADCVCESCRRAHGAAVVTWIGVKTQQFSVQADSAMLVWYPSSKDSERGFCSRCGTRLFFRSKKWPGETHMALACVDEPHNYRATDTAFRSEMPAWTSVQLPATST